MTIIIIQGKDETLPKDTLNKCKELVQQTTEDEIQESTVDIGEKIYEITGGYPDYITNTNHSDTICNIEIVGITERIRTENYIDYCKDAIEEIKRLKEKETITAEDIKQAKTIQDSARKIDMKDIPWYIWGELGAIIKKAENKLKQQQ